MRTRRTMHGKRRRRSALKFLGAICAIVKGIRKKKPGSEKIEGYFGGDIQNYAPTESQKYNPMEQASKRLQDKDMNIERDKQ